MSSRSVRTRTANALRRVARRPRAWLRALAAHRSTATVRRRARGARDRAGLTLQALRGRRGRAEAWSRLVAEVTAQPAPPAMGRLVSIVMIPALGSAASTPPAAPLGTPRPGVDASVAQVRPGETRAAAAARTAARTTGELICFVAASSAAIEPGWIARLAAAVDDANAVAAAPLAVHPLRTWALATPDDARVRSAGLEVAVESDAPVLRARGAGDVVKIGGGTEPVAGATAACLLVDRGAYEGAGGLPALPDLDLAGFELCRRLRAHGGAVVVVPGAVVVDHRPVASRRALTTPIAPEAPAWRAYVDEHGPQLMRDTAPLPGGRLRIAVTVAAPSAKVAERWGDWHLAQALARSLRALGHHVVVQTLDHADDLAIRACDVHCVVRGLQPVRRTPGQAHVIWVISHPESIAAAECDAADLVFVASVRFADALRTRTRTPVEVLLQATDATRFRPLPAQPRHAHDVAIVAKSRDVFRPVVADALAAGLRPAIYGSGWDEFVDPALVVSDYVANEDLAQVYSSVGVLLNDHWETMREWGFVSNRLFDALACGTPVISEELLELDDLFDGTVLTYRDVAGLRELVDAVLADRSGARERARRGGDLVRSLHTFDHRAAEFVEALYRLGLDPGGPDSGTERDR